MGDLFEECSLWPVRVVLPGRVGWSLWGGRFLLPAGARYALFDTAEALWGHVRRDRSAYLLAGTPGWPRLLDRIRAADPDVSGVVDIRLDRLAEWTPRAEPSIEPDLVNGLDLIHDLGDQLADPVLMALSGPSGALNDLYGTLWGDAVTVVDPERVAGAARQAVTRAAELAVWNPEPSPE